jgi:peroxiredoxin
MKFLFIALSFLFSYEVKAQFKVGDTVPDIVLNDINGKPVALYALKGKVVLIDFWASWCGPCRKSNKTLTSIYKKYHANGFEIYGISIDDNPADWKKAIAADKINWIQVLDAGGWNAPVSNAWKVEQIPTAYLIDKNGKVVAIDPEKSNLQSYLQKNL